MTPTNATKSTLMAHLYCVFPAVPLWNLFSSLFIMIGCLLYSPSLHGSISYLVLYTSTTFYATLLIYRLANNTDARPHTPRPLSLKRYYTILFLIYFFSRLSPIISLLNIYATAPSVQQMDFYGEDNSAIIELPTVLDQPSKATYICNTKQPLLSATLTNALQLQHITITYWISIHHTLLSEYFTIFRNGTTTFQAHNDSFMISYWSLGDISSVEYPNTSDKPYILTFSITPTHNLLAVNNSVLMHALRNNQSDDSKRYQIHLGDDNSSANHGGSLTLSQIKCTTALTNLNRLFPHPIFDQN